MYFIGKLFSCSWMDGSTATCPFLGVHPGPAHVHGIRQRVFPRSPERSPLTTLHVHGKPLFSFRALLGVEFRDTGLQHLFRERSSVFFHLSDCVLTEFGSV